MLGHCHSAIMKLCQRIGHGTGEAFSSVNSVTKSGKNVRGAKTQQEDPSIPMDTVNSQEYLAGPMDF